MFMCDECISLHKVCDVCGEPAFFCCRLCRIRFCRACNFSLRMKDRAVGYCFNCGLKLNAPKKYY